MLSLFRVGFGLAKDYVTSNKWILYVIGVVLLVVGLGTALMYYGSYREKNGYNLAENLYLKKLSDIQTQRELVASKINTVVSNLNDSKDELEQKLSQAYQDIDRVAQEKENEGQKKLDDLIASVRDGSFRLSDDAGEYSGGDNSNQCPTADASGSTSQSGHQSGCRLSAKVTEDLLRFATEANDLRDSLNMCIDVRRAQEDAIRAYQLEVKKKLEEAGLKVN